jgi:hypothetical protein
MNVREHERVVLTEDIAASGLEAGDVGTVIHVYSDGTACEVEFVALDGTTAAVVTLETDKVRPVRKHEIAHARALAAA